jgi:hypothetical protein
VADEPLYYVATLEVQLVHVTAAERDAADGEHAT